MFILLSQLQQLLDHLLTFWLEPSNVHQLLIVLPPRAHVAFFRHELRRFAVIDGDEVQDLIIFGESAGALGHILGLITSTTILSLFKQVPCCS